MKELMLPALFAAGLLGLLLSGCQTVPYQGVARDVKKKPMEGGIIAVPLDPRAEDRTKAEEKMKQTCQGGPYKILEEGEVVIGQKTNSNSRETKRDRDQTQVGSLFGLPVMAGDAGGKDSNTESTVSQVKEWQISYNCEKSGAKTAR